MTDRVSRRRFLGTALVGAAVVAFDPLRSGWVTAAEAAEGAVGGAVAVPDLDGELTIDPAALAAAADDFGHLVHRTPLAVLRPGSVDDVVALVRYANRHGIAVAMRGQGHSTNGQSQAHAGVVIDSSTLDQVHEIGPDGPVRDFGPAPHVVGIDSLGVELQEIATEELTPSGLLCTPQGVLDVSFMQSSIRFHDLNGNLVWEHEIEGFTPIVAYTPDGMGLGRMFDPNEGSHLLRSVTYWGSETALVQHELRTREIPEEGEIEVFESRLVRLSGAGLQLGNKGGTLVLRDPTGAQVHAVSYAKADASEEDRYIRFNT